MRARMWQVGRKRRRTSIDLFLAGIDGHGALSPAQVARSTREACAGRVLVSIVDQGVGSTEGFSSSLSTAFKPLLPGIAELLMPASICSTTFAIETVVTINAGLHQNFVLSGTYKPLIVS